MGATGAASARSRVPVHGVGAWEGKVVWKGRVSPSPPPPWGEESLRPHRPASHNEKFGNVKARCPPHCPSISKTSFPPLGKSTQEHVMGKEVGKARG